MEIVIKPESLMMSGKGSITGVIYLKINDDFFPDEGWNDFIVVVLNWWVEQLNSVKNSEEISRFQFMDGPYSYSISRQSNNNALIALYEDNKLLRMFTICIDEYSRSLAKACKEVSQKLYLLNWTNKDVEKLRAGWGVEKG